MSSTTATPSAKVAIIICSTRTPRLGPSVAQFIKDTLSQRDSSSTTTYHLVDVADFKLPVFDETILPAMVPSAGPYTKPHTKAWSAEISQYGGYIFVTPEYNYGLPASTKNAVDFLYNEWTGKPAVVVSYGIQGANLANANLAKTLEGMKLLVAETKPALKFHGGSMSPDMFAAVQGNLGEETKKDWENEDWGKSEILKAVGELEEKLVEALVPRKEGE